MGTDRPLAYFITWTVYGTHLQGDIDGWTRRRKGEQLPQPFLVAWRAERLKYSVPKLTPAQRQTMEEIIRLHCDLRNWTLWRANVRSTHAHAIVTAIEHSGDQVRDQLKANCTRVLRKRWPEFEDRPIWTVGGDWRCINTEEGLQTVFEYVDQAQDRKGVE